MRIAIIGFLFAACATLPTPYQPKDADGFGYDNFQSGQAAHYVIFRGNRATSREEAVRHWNTRAAAICGGPERYDIAQFNSSEDTKISTFNAGGNVYTVNKRYPVIDGYIRCK